MFYSERREEIMEILKQKNYASVHYLAKKLFVSEPTIRRDLLVLEKENRIKRTFGGAMANDMTNNEIPLELREKEDSKAKKDIAQQALKYIKDGQVLFFDASSTVLELSKYLSKFNGLTVITNSPKTSMQLAECNIKSFCTGGILLEKSIAYVGTYAENFIRNFNADYFFFSCRGISDDGILSDSSMEESDLRRVMMQHSKKNIFLCTSNKIGKKYMYNFSDISKIDKIICDVPLPEQLNINADL